MWNRNKYNGPGGGFTMDREADFITGLGAALIMGPAEDFIMDLGVDFIMGPEAVSIMGPGWTL